MTHHDDTIVAIATPPGEGGVGILRISGPEAVSIVSPLWRGKPSFDRFESHKLYHGPIVDPKTSQPLDQVLVVRMNTPHSYTGEEVVEIQAHGGPVLLETILQVLLKEGGRLAHPGEFTERAFLNGRLDLTQAEGVADLIGAQSELAQQLASQQLAGGLATAVGKIRNDLKVMRAQVEAMINFPEDEDVCVLRYDEVAIRVGVLANQIQKWLATFAEGRRRREGLRVVLAGRPNVGKSSLLNALTAEERAIVHAEAGTTRDVVETFLYLNGLLVRLFDTAGLREGGAEVESEGIRRSWQQIKECDLVLFVVDGSVPATPEDREQYEAICEHEHMVLLNKSDLIDDGSCRGENLPSAVPRSGVTGRKASPRHPSPKQELLISAKTGNGLEALKAALFEFALPHGRASDQLYLANQRHKVCLEKTREALSCVIKSAQEEAGLELVAADLLVAANHLGEITGEITHDEILGEIFSRFCLGK